MVARFDVHLAHLDPGVESEFRKARPCIVVSPDELNKRLRTIVVIPMTSRARRFPNRVRIVFQGTEGEIATEQIRALDKSRLGRRLGHITDASARILCRQLQEMFAYG